MLEWKEIAGVKKSINYRGHKEYGVYLPELNEEVLFCRSNYRDKTRDIYFSGYIYEDNCGLQLVNSIVGGTEPVIDGIKWARFNKPETKNNIIYGIAYLDEYGNELDFKWGDEKIMEIKLYKIETKNPYSNEIEYYAVSASNKNEAKINFTMEYPSFKVRDVCYIEGNVIKLNVWFQGRI